MNRSDPPLQGAPFAFPRLTLFLAGFALILLQFFMIREISALLKGTEIVILMVTVAYFTGSSVGYGLAPHLSRRGVRIGAAATLLIHLTLPFSLRWIGGWAADYSFGATYAIALFVAAFLLSSFFSLLLPRFIDQAAGGEGDDPLLSLYSAELAGAVAGAGAIWLVAPHGPFAITLLYEIVMAAVTALVMGNGPLSVAAALAGVAGYALFFSPLWDGSLAYYYARLYPLRDPVPLYSAYSPYQKVDIVESARGRRYIFLDGLQNYGDVDLSAFNAYLTGVPTTLNPQGKVLIIGSGSMESVAAASPVSASVTTVEIDAAVLAGARRWMADVNKLERATNWTPVIDDAKRYVGATDERYDIVILDIPAPLSIQVGLLYSEDFFRLVRSRLAPGGILSVTLAGTFEPDEPTARTVAAGLIRVFPQVVAYTPTWTGRSFALAGEKDAFTPEEAKEAVYGVEKGEFSFYDDAEVRAITGDKRPMTYDDMRYPVKRSMRRVIVRTWMGDR
ncbi:MAG: hypothetical protein HQK87_03850 [Nitrospinae bacterium]|nr:hypothetical protein [Nitrospinota bacterium]